MEDNTHDAVKPHHQSVAQAVAAANAQDGDVINVSGHKQELNRIFDALSTISVAITSGNVWPALGGTITVAIYNGGPPGIIYEYIAASVLYWFVAASIAELASAIPSSGGDLANAYIVYHWATVTAGRYGKLCGYLAGWWNFFAWCLATASTVQICSNVIVAMYALNHSGLTELRWMVFIVYVVLTWLLAALVLFANWILPQLEQICAFFVVAGFFITIVVCAATPHVNGQPYASSSFVWTEWQNDTGYSSSGFAFLLGMPNGAFAVGTPDITSHLAEEIPRPQTNIPWAILAQFAIGFPTGFFYLIPVFYGIHDLPKIQNSGSLFPLADIYLQVTGSAAGSIGLLFLVFVPIFGGCVGNYLTSSRVFWTLARDRATPFSGVFSKISQKWKNPFNAILPDAVLCTALGCIYIGNATAFSAFVSSFAVLTMASYTAAILPHLLSRRSNIAPGPFWMKGLLGYVANAISCLFMLTFIVIFCFPFGMPVTVETMNYTCVIFGGLTIIFGAFYLVLRKNYEGPKVVQLEGAEAEVLVAEYRASVSPE